jgi:hypothetical protein
MLQLWSFLILFGTPFRGVLVARMAQKAGRFFKFL